MSDRLESIECIKCGQSGDSSFHDIFNDVGIELQLDSLLEHHFNIKVVYNPFHNQVVCGECVNRLIELFDIEERFKERETESITGEREKIIVERGTPCGSGNSNANHTATEQYTTKVKDEEVFCWDDQEIFEYVEFNTDEVSEVSAASVVTNKGFDEFQDFDLEIYADVIINSNLEELQLERESTCNICFESFTKHQDLLMHIKKQHEHEKGFYPCVLENCHKILRSERRLARHIVLKHYNLSEIPIFGACRDCGITFSNFLDFNKHSCCTTLKYREKIPSYCSICNMKFPTFRRFRFHKQFHLEKRRPRVCLLCDRCFTDSEEFFEHVHYEHEPEDRLICIKCDRCFKNKKLFETHLANHNLELKYKCTLCHKAYTQNNRLQNHMESYHNSGDHLKCEFCNKILSNRDYFRNHMKLHEPEVDVQVNSCTACALVGRDKMYLQKHTENRSSKCFKAPIEEEFLSVVYLCEYCDETFKTKVGLKNHRDTGIHVDKLFHCSLCSATFNELRKVRAHFKSHKIYEDWQKSFPLLRKYMCDVGDCQQSYAMWMSLCSHKAMKHKEIQLICTKCNRQFENKVDFDRHSEKCEKSDQHDCQFCGKKCTSKMSLSVHMARSHNNKNVNCTVCKASFKDHEILQKHIDFVHVQMECKLCNKKVKNQRNLLLHERVKHRNVKRYFCESCDKGFYNKSDMEAHERTAHSMTNFVCEKCPFTTNYKNSLDVHMAMHNNDLQYECPICGRHFARKRVLDLHVKRHEVHREFVCSDHVANGCPASFITRHLLKKHIKEKHTSNQETTGSAPKVKHSRRMYTKTTINTDVGDIDADDPVAFPPNGSNRCQMYLCYNNDGEQVDELITDCIEVDMTFRVDNN